MSERRGKLALIWVASPAVALGAIFLLRPLVGTTPALVIVGIALAVLLGASLARVRSNLIGDTRLETLDPVLSEEVRRAYLLARPSRYRRAVTLLAVLGVPVIIVLGWATGWNVLSGLIPLLVILLVLAGVAEDKKDRDFMRQDRGLHERYSPWRAKGPLSKEAMLFRRALMRHWLTGKDPQWPMTPG